MARAPVALPEGVSESMSDEDTALLAADAADRTPVPERGRPEPVEEAAPVEVKTETKAPAESAAEPAAGAATVETPEERANKETAVGVERKARKEAEKRARELEDQVAKFNGRFEVLQTLAQQQSAPKADEPATIEIPDVNVDPIGHFQALYQEQSKFTAKLAEQLQAQQQQSQNFTNVQRLGAITSQHEAAFTATEPSYPQAIQHLIQGRQAELEAMGIADPMQRQEAIRNDFATIAAQALQSGGNIAERLMAVAKARGFAPAPDPTPAAAVVAPPAPTPAEQITAAAEAAKAKLDTVNAGQQATQSLGQVAGGAVNDAMTLEKLMGMSDEDFAAATKGGKWKHLMENAARR